MKQYYFISYTIDNRPCTCVADEHPFKWIEFFKELSGNWLLKDWKEITKTEYELGKTTIGIG